MPHYCCVPGCKNRGTGHKFPPDPDRRQKWIVNIKRLDPDTGKLWEPSPRSVVCRSHFTPEDYATTLLGERGRLKNTAVPRLHITDPFLTSSRATRRAKRMKVSIVSNCGDSNMAELSTISSPLEPKEEDPSPENGSHGNIIPAELFKQEPNLSMDIKNEIDEETDVEIKTEENDSADLSMDIKREIDEETDVEIKTEDNDSADLSMDIKSEIDEETDVVIKTEENNSANNDMVEKWVVNTRLEIANNSGIDNRNDTYENLQGSAQTETTENPYIVIKPETDTNFDDDGLHYDGSIEAQESMLTHQEYCHTGEKTHVCSECGKSFPHKTSLRNHQAIHKGKPYTCTAACVDDKDASKGKKDKVRPVERIVYHLIPKDKKKAAKKLQAIAAKLSAHENSQSKTAQSQAKVKGTYSRQKQPETAQSQTKVRAKYPRRKLDMRFRRSLTIYPQKESGRTDSHVQTNSNSEQSKAANLAVTDYAQSEEGLANGNEGAPNPKNTGKRYACEVCERTFANPQSRNYHEFLHRGEKPFKCGECGKAFTHNGSLTRHKFVHAPQQKPHVCEECGKSYVQRAHLRNHQLVHSADKPFICHICGEAFALESMLIHHEYLHTGEKPHVCSECGKSYLLKSSLTNHQAIRKGNPYTCTVCNESFASKCSFTKHELSHPESREKPTYRCTFCDRSFTYYSSFTKHELSHTENTNACTD